MDDQRRVEVRRAGAGDVPGLVEGSAGLFAEDAGTQDPGVNLDWPRQDGPRHFADSVGDPGQLVLVADFGGEIVGQLTGTMRDGSAIRPAKVATLASLYVRPEHRRGQVGARLVEGFFAWAREQGAGVAEVNAYTANTEAIRFYERNGFTPRAVRLDAAL